MMLERLRIFLETALNKDPINDLEFQAEFILLYKEYFDETIQCSTCKKDYRTAIQRLQKKYNNLTLNTNDMANSRFKAKLKNLIYSGADQKHYQSDEMTDEQVIRMIAKNPRTAQKFDCPKGWEKEVKDYIAGEETKAAEKKAAKDAARENSDKGKDAEGSLDKCKMTVAYALGIENDKVEECINGSVKKGLNAVAKKVGLPDYIAMGEEQIKAELIALHNAQVAKEVENK